MSRKPRNNQADIVRVAADLFATHGYHQTSMQQIADDVGILKGSLYHHFRNKHEILVAITAEPLTDLIKRVEKIAAGAGSMEDKMRAAIHAHIDALVGAYPHLMIVTAETDEALPEGARDLIIGLRRRYQRAWNRMIDAGRRDGALAVDLPSTAVVNLVLGAINWMHRWYRPTGPVGADELADALATMVLRGMVADDHRR